MRYEQQYCHDKGDVDEVKAVLDSKRGLIWEKKKAFVIRLRVCRRLPPPYFIPGTPPEETNFKQVVEYSVCSTNVCAVYF